jgi:flagellar motor protein MotB
MNNPYPVTNRPEEENLAAELSQIQEILRESEMAESARLAYAGQYKEAEIKLVQLAKRQPDHAILDLLARVRVQQGDLIQAELLWRQALEYQPNCKDCLNAIAEIQQLRALKINPRQRTENRLRGIFIWATGILLIGLFIFLALMFQSAARGSTAQLATLNASVSDLGSAVGALPTDNSAEIIARLDTNNELIYGLATQVFQPTSAPVAAAAFASSVPAVDLSGVKGVTARVEGDSLVVTFSSALFKYETLFTDPGKEALTQVGNLIRPLSGQITVDVIGFMDISEISRSDLSLLRSAAVITYLQETIPLPQSDFRILSSEGIGAPFNNDLPEERLKNRTVVLIIRNR